jgi:hypothetical protein
LREISLLRQVVVVSYGTRFLQGTVALEDWHRHDLLADARFQFRALAGNALLADDVTWWLSILKLSGATRLSLHLAAQFELQLPHVWRGGDYAIVVHYPEHHEIWAVGEERVDWLAHPLVTDETRYSHPVFPGAASDDVESYWQIDSRPGALEIAATNWKKLVTAIAADLAITVPSSLVPFGPFTLPKGATRAQLPLFPFTEENAKAHHIVATLDREQSTFSNDMNPKNENTFEQRMDEKVHEWGKRLDSWMIEVLLRGANDIGRAAAKDSAFQPRIHTSAPVPASSSPEMPHTVAPPGKHPDADALSPSGSRWTSRFVLAFMIAVSTVFFVAVANVIVAWPWLAILIGLPFALYAQGKK